MSEAALANSQGGNLSLTLNYTSGPQATNNNLATELFQNYGASKIQGSVNNIAAAEVGAMVNSVIDSLAMPDFMKDAAKMQVENILKEFTGSSPAGLDKGVKEVIDKGTSESGGQAANDSKSPSASPMDIMGQSMLDEMKEATGGSSKAGSEGGGGNWLAILARSLGKTAGEHLKKMVELGEKMGELDSKEDPEAFAQVQSEFQAESQIFKMFQEAIGTMVKSIGEGMSTVARKQ